MFLAGLNKELDEVRGRILGKKPLPSMQEVFSEIRREEGRRIVMLGGNPSLTTETESSALVTKGYQEEGKKDGKRPWCDHCKRPWHTCETCWKIHGKPLNWKKKTVNEGRALQTGALDQGQQSSTGSFPFTKEQIDQLYKLLQPQTNPSCSLAQNGNYLIAALASVNLNCPWIIDSRETDHMTGLSKLFSSYSPCARNQKIKIADGFLSAIAGKRSIIVSHSLTLNDVLHVPNISCNLLSISKLTRDQNCQANFFPSRCEFQDLISRKMIGSARQSEGLYFFEDGSNLRQQSQSLSTCLESMSVSSDNDIMLWHFRLGHPSFRYLKYLFPKLFMNKDPSFFKCEICELAKHHRVAFPSQPYKPSKPFSIIHSDVWGPNRISTLSNKRWFITFTDDHTRLCWVYLLKEKSEVEQVFKIFYRMVQTQFQTNIQIFKSDNGKEYFNSILGNFFLEKGIIHQSFCIDTPQQNDIAERKK